MQVRYKGSYIANNKTQLSYNKIYHVINVYRYCCNPTHSYWNKSFAPGYRYRLKCNTGNIWWYRTSTIYLKLLREKKN